MRNIMTEEADAVMSVMERFGGDSWVVGGAVRDAILDHDVHDVDVCTTLPPQSVMKLFSEQGFKVVPTGISHGTVTIVMNGVSTEVTTLRREVSLGTGPGGRSAAVTWSTDIAEDAMRRDFTMNAIYMRRNGEILDPVGGVKDAKAGVIRFVGDAEQRISEDPLRAFRFFRFMAEKRMSPDPESLDAVARSVDKMSPLSRERVGWEMRRILSADRNLAVIGLMSEHGYLDFAIPDASHSALAYSAALLENSGVTDKAMFLLALSGAFPKREMSLTNAECKTITDAMSAVMTEQDAKRGHLFGVEMAMSAGIVRHLFGASPSPDESEISRGAAAEFVKPDLSGLTGKELGEAIREAKERWLSDGLPEQTQPESGVNPS